MPTEDPSTPGGIFHGPSILLLMVVVQHGDMETACGCVLLSHL